MPKVAKELSVKAVQALKNPGRYPVGGVSGLQLYVNDNGARSWVLRTMIGKKRRDIGIGSLSEYSLKEAREKARIHKKNIREGIDPISERKAARAALVSAQAKGITFKDAASRCYEAKAPEFRNDKHSKDWISSLENHAFPVIGNLPICDVEMSHILKILEPIWTDKTETATRLRQRIESVLTWATVSGFRTGENPARWLGNLKEVLPNPSKIKRQKHANGNHHPALPHTLIGEFMADLREREGVSVRALEFVILTAARSGEVRELTWNEVDLNEKLWTIPANKTKAGREHKVPLSTDALKLIKSALKMKGSPYVFASPRGGNLSDMALTSLIRRMDAEKEKRGDKGYKDPTTGRVAVTHGFRSCFKDWARSRTSYPDEISELCLAHVSSDATRAAYARADLLPKRLNLLKDWAKYCGTVQRSGDVVAIRGKMKEKRDPDITEDIINHIRAIIDRDDKAKAEFIANYPDKYPEPRRKQEWQAYKELKKVWTDNEIDAFISAYDTDDMIYPGILDQPGKPSLTEFLHDVGLLAEGRYALTLPTSEMLSLLAGEYASKQHESSKVGASKTNQRFLDAKQTAIKTARELWAADSEKEYLKRDMIGYCFQDLRAKGLYIPSEEKLWEWLKLEPGLVPDYASQPGRPAKS